MRRVIGLFLTAVASAMVALTINAAPANNIDHIVTVAKSGGDHSSIKKALAAIQDNSKTNRYQIFIGPGVFSVTEQIEMKTGVSIKGSGIGVTTLQSRIREVGSERAMFHNGLAESTYISDLSVDMYINATYHSDRVLVCTHFCPVLKDVDFLIRSNLAGVMLIGIDLDLDFHSFSPVFENITVNAVSSKATDPQGSIGIRSERSGLNLVRSRVVANTAIEMIDFGGRIQDSFIAGRTYSNGVAISTRTFPEEPSVLSVLNSRIATGGQSILVKTDETFPMPVYFYRSTLSNPTLQGPEIHCVQTDNGLAGGVFDENCFLIP